MYAKIWTQARGNPRGLVSRLILLFVLFVLVLAAVYSLISIHHFIAAEPKIYTRDMDEINGKKRKNVNVNAARNAPNAWREAEDLIRQSILFCTGCSGKIHCNPSLAYIAVRDLQSFQRNATVQSLLFAGNFLYNQ